MCGKGFPYHLNISASVKSPSRRLHTVISGTSGVHLGPQSNPTFLIDDVLSRTRPT